MNKDNQKCASEGYIPTALSECKITLFYLIFWNLFSDKSFKQNRETKNGEATCFEIALLHHFDAVFNTQSVHLQTEILF